MSGVREAKLGGLVKRAGTWNPRRSGNGASFEYIDLSSIDQDGKVISAVHHIRSTEAPSRARQLVAAGDVLVSTVRPNLNAVAIVPDELDGATASTGFCVLRVRPDSLDSRFLFHWVRSPRFVDTLVRGATGASYPAVTDGFILGTTLPLPPLPEQRRIADVLDRADALRSARRSGIVLLSQLVIAAFGAHFSPAELAERVPLARAFAIRPNYGTMIPPTETGGFLSLRVKNIQNASLDLSDTKYVDLPPKDRRRHSVEDGDLLMARAIGSLEHLGKCVVVYPGDAQWAFDSHLMRIRLDRTVMLPSICGSGYLHQAAGQHSSESRDDPPYSTTSTPKRSPPSPFLYHRSRSNERSWGACRRLRPKNG